MSDEPNKKSQYYRVIYCNMFGINFNGLETTVLFSTLNDIGDPTGGSEDQVKIGMSASNLKALGMVIAAFVEYHETHTGAEIPVNESVNEMIKKSIK